MTLKISFDEVQAAQRVVRSGIEDMHAVTRSILGQAGASQIAMEAPAGRVAADTFAELGGGARALAESLAELHVDLSRLQEVALEGSDVATRTARSVAHRHTGAAAGAVAGAVTTGMRG